MQRDFRREVEVCSDDVRSEFSDVEAQHIEEGGLSPAKSSKSTCVSSREIKGWRVSGSNTPSIASTLRMPTEPFPMIRISTEPSTASSSLQSVPMETGLQSQSVPAYHVKKCENGV